MRTDRGFDELVRRHWLRILNPEVQVVKNPAGPMRKCEFMFATTGDIDRRDS